MNELRNKQTWIHGFMQLFFNGMNSIKIINQVWLKSHLSIHNEWYSILNQSVINLVWL